MRTAIAAAVTIAITGGCGPSLSSTVIPYTGPPATQASSGESTYSDACASCHGEHGEGLEGHPALIGAGAIPRDPSPGAKSRSASLTTAKDLFAYVKAEMPPLSPGSLPDDAAWAVVAYVLRENGAKWGPDDLGPKNAAAIPIHR